MVFFKKFNYCIGGVFILCVLSRLITSIYYIEDIDSMRFYFSAIDYDVFANRPHFPGYPLYCLLLKCCYYLSNSIQFSFALIGGISIFLILHFSLKSYRLISNNQYSWFLMIILFFNPLLWLMSNRYMPDLFGLACLVICVYHYLTFNSDNKKHIYYLAFFTALLAGVRISYLPFLIPIFLFQLRDIRSFLKLFFATALFCLLWIIPWIFIVGVDDLYNLAINNTHGHFFKWGGTIYSSEKPYLIRIIRLFESLTAHSFNCWWPGRNWITIVNSLIFSVLIFIGFKRMSCSKRLNRRIIILITCLVVYGLWIYFFQNISYKPRHVLPFIPFVAMYFTSSISALRRKVIANLFILMCLIPFIFSSCKLVTQHANESALSQLSSYLNSIEYPVCVYIQNDLMEYYVSKFLTNDNVLIVKNLHHYFDINESNDISLISTLSIEHDLLCQEDRSHFFHNPFVNRLWSHIEIIEYNKYP